MGYYKHLPNSTITMHPLQESSNAMEDALTKKYITHLNPQSFNFGIKTWEVCLLADGAYNQVWLLYNKAIHHESSSPFALTNCYEKYRTRPRHYRLERSSFAKLKRKLRRTKPKMKKPSLHKLLKLTCQDKFNYLRL